VQISEARPDIVIFRGQEVALRPAEYKLLRALARRPQQCVPYQELYNQIWGPDEIVEPAQVYWHRSQLVKKLRQVDSKDTNQYRFARCPAAAICWMLSRCASKLNKLARGTAQNPADVVY